MHTIKYLFIDLSYYPVSFKLRVFEKLTNTLTNFINKTTNTLIALSECSVSLFRFAKFDWATCITTGICNQLIFGVKKEKKIPVINSANYQHSLTCTSSYIFTNQRWDSLFTWRKHVDHSMVPHSISRFIYRSRIIGILVGWILMDTKW